MLRVEGAEEVEIRGLSGGLDETLQPFSISYAEVTSIVTNQPAVQYVATVNPITLPSYPFGSGPDYFESEEEVSDLMGDAPESSDHA